MMACGLQADSYLDEVSGGLGRGGCILHMERCELLRAEWNMVDCLPKWSNSFHPIFTCHSS